MEVFRQSPGAFAANAAHKPNPIVSLMNLIHLQAQNDTYGNPRRCFVLFDDKANVLGTWDEGYQGRNCLPEHLRNMAAPVIKVQAAEYNKYVKSA